MMQFERGDAAKLCISDMFYQPILRSIKMGDNLKSVTNDTLTEVDASFYSALGWLAAIAVSIAGWACNA